RAGIAGRRGSSPSTPCPGCDSRTGTDVRKAAADPNDRSRVIAVTTAFRRPPLCSSISSSALRMCQSWPRRVYIWVGKDVFDGAVSLRLAGARRMDEVLWFLGECWKDLGRPEQMQLDNARELAGWGPAARTLSRVIRLCLRFGVSPVFIPEG